MPPVIALIGRPNVGKSTLFNRITGTDHAIVSPLAGLTRDRQYGMGVFDSTRFVVIDAGGISSVEKQLVGIDAFVFNQSKIAIQEADEILMLVDASEGLNPGDVDLVRFLRKLEKKIHLVINKIDGYQEELVMPEFFSLGMDSIFSIAAINGRGVKSMLAMILDGYKSDQLSLDSITRADRIKLAVIGRPNVGKSTLINSLLRKDRLVVYDQPGTTRDSIYVDCEWRGRSFTLIDTAGARRRSKIHEVVEKYSIAKTLQAIANAHVVLYVFDAVEGVVDQDLTLLSHCIKSGRGLVLVVNKWDDVASSAQERLKIEILRKLTFTDFAELNFVSALFGNGFGRLYKSVEATYKSFMISLSTPHLNKILKRAQLKNPPPMIRGRRVKLRYAHAGGNNPPRVIIHGNQVAKIPDNYLRYLEKYFRTELSLSGVSLRLEFRISKNPFEGRANKLNRRQLEHRKRLMRYVSKKKKNSRRRFG